jgi:hypothetical protein
MYQTSYQVLLIIRRCRRAFGKETLAICPRVAQLVESNTIVYRNAPQSLRPLDNRSRCTSRENLLRIDLRAEEISEGNLRWRSSSL